MRFYSLALILVSSLFAIFPASAKSSGCWVKFYAAKNFRGHSQKLFFGPKCVQSVSRDGFATGGRGHWGFGEADSMKVGPSATVVLYSKKNFQGQSVRFRSNSRVDELEDYYVGRSLDSFKIYCDGKRIRCGF